ncbi:helix-turn-helix domain-containing protein [Helcococcus kunzii]|nr:helix-turn-helix transcriptional regulator [Helcococcus kunzii]
MNNLGTKIAELRKEKAMTQNDLADALGVSS